MKKTITILLVLILCQVAEVAKADFTFGEPVNLREVISVIDAADDVIDCLSYDGLEIYIHSYRAGPGDLWRIRRDSIDEDWGPAENLGPTVNSAYHEALSTISANGLTLYFNSTKPGGYGEGDTYMSTRATKDDPWGEAVNIGQPVNTPYKDGGCWLVANGLELYYNSDRPDGYGDWDIWVTKRDTIDDDWGEPENLGPTINSPSYEGLPCISADGLLLSFTSDRPGGYGDMDIWMARRASVSSPWEQPVNLSPTVNSPVWEHWSRISPDGSTLYFYTNTDGIWDQWQAPISPIVDFNSDGIVDDADMCIMVEHWLTDYPLCDIGPMPWGDGIVDVQDLMVLAEHLFEDYRLIAHWALDEEVGNIAYDSAGEYDADLHGKPIWQPTGGKKGGTLQFDGVDNYISTPFILNPSKESLSAFAWIKGGEPGQVILSQSNTVVNHTTRLGNAWLWADSSYGRLITRLMHPPFDPLISESIITDSRWHHVGLVYDIIRLRRYLYVDGVKVAEDTTFVGGDGLESGLYIGAGESLVPSSFFSGLIDDVRIYNGVLSAEEIAAVAQ